jgi:hypothetical protein
MTRRRGPCRAIVFALFSSVTLSCFAASPLDPYKASVEKIRGRKFVTEVKNVTLERSKLPAMLRAQMAQELPYSLDEWVTVLRAMQLVDVDPKQVVPKLLALYESQVLAFYDPHTHTYYSLDAVPEKLKEMGDPKMLEEMVAVHELQHAIQDQHFGISAKTEALRRDTDGSMAYHSLLEGEAVLVMIAHMLDKGGMKLDDLIGSDELVNTVMTAAQGDQSVDPSTPPFFAESLKFPDLQGLKFVVAAYRRGGWPALDKVHANPPRSTREVMNPDEYFARTTRAVAWNPAPPAGIANVLAVEHGGAFTWSFLVGADNSRGWVDDKITIVRGAAPTVLVETKWESPELATKFATAYEAFLAKRGVGARVVRSGSIVKAVYGPDAKAKDAFAPPPAAKAAA